MKGKKRSPQGAIVMFLETDLERIPIFDERKFTPLQAQVFSCLSSTEQAKIRAGYGTIVANLNGNQERCYFNMDNYRPPESALENFARAIFPEIREYFSKEENRRKFEEHIKAHDKE